MDLSNVKKALIIQNKFIGDVLVSSLLAKNIKKINPTIQVDFFCYDKAIGILENNPYIDNIISFNDSKLKSFPVLLQYIKKIRKEQYDLILDPYAKLQSQLITLFSNAKTRISYKKPFFRFFYTHTYKREKIPKFIACTSIENRCFLLSDFINPKSMDFQTEIFLTENEINTAKQEMLNKGVSFKKPILVLGILGSSLEKSWPLSYMGNLINHILETFDVDILLNYIPDQKKYADEVISHIKPEHKNSVFLGILGNNIREFAAIMKNCNGLIANEGGAINIAKALQIPTYSIFSPHKFREDWACYENLDMHRSFHLQDIYPEIYSYYKLKTTLNQPEVFYKLIEPKHVIPKALEHIKNSINPAKKTSTPSEFTSEKQTITSLCICYNEEEYMRKYLDNISRFSDEIIVVDSFSTDKTIDIIKSYPNIKLVQRKFDNFISQKNYAIDLAKSKWLTFFDPDERLSNSLIAEILYTTNKPNSEDAYWVCRSFYFQNKHIKHSGVGKDTVIRLFKNGTNKYADNKLVHEQMILTDKTGYLENKLAHYSFSSLESYKEKLNLYSTLQAQELYSKKKRVNTILHIYIKPWYRFFKHYIVKLGVLDGKEGLLISLLYKDYVKDRYIKLKKLWGEK